MGSWAKKLFGRATFNQVGIVLAGTNPPEFEKEILALFDSVESSKDAVYHAHLVKKNGQFYPLVTNVYGAPAMVDVMSEMHDGGCRTLLFIGYAYGGFKNLEVGTIVIPEKSYHYEGIYHPIDPDRKIGTPDPILKDKITSLLNKKKISFTTGTNISVPAVTFQLPHAHSEYQKIKPITLEMELAACFSRAKDLGIRTVGILIVSDNRSSSIADTKKRVLRRKAKRNMLQIIIGNLNRLQLPILPLKKKFKIDEYLASIIESKSRGVNIYRKKKIRFKQ